MATPKSTAYGVRRLLRPLFAGVALCLLGPAHAQDAAPAVDLPKLNLQNYAPQDQALPDLTTETGRLNLAAALTEDSAPLADGVTWRVFSSTTGADGKLQLIAKAEGGSARFDVPEGSYLVHAAFGRAGATKKILVGTENISETLVLDAGGLTLGAEAIDGAGIPAFKLTFSIYDAEVDADGERRLIAEGVTPGVVVGLNSGAYHVVSNYGAVNAIMRTDLRVEPGVITEATLQHRAAEVILKLVADAGGEALADTAWSVYTESGELLLQSVGAYAPVVLAEGAYTAVATHREQVFEKEFVVASGRNDEVEVIANLK